MDEGPRTVAVVIPSWNSAGLLPRCLDSLADQGVELEVLVVDNGSRDGSLELLHDRGVPHVALPRNVGFAAAVNLGAARVASETILALNADTMLEPGAVSSLLSALEADRTLGGVQPRILQLEGATGASNVDAARLYSAGQALTRDGRALELGAGCQQEARWLRGREIFGVCGAACMLRRGLFTELGGYDERYFAFYEDVDLNVRARIAGRRFEYVPEAIVWHLGNASWQTGFHRPSQENARLVARNRIATQVKFMPATAIPLILGVEAAALLRAAARRRFLATLRGKLEALRWLVPLMRERRALRRGGNPRLARRWLGIR